MIANVLNRLRPPPPPGSATCPAQERVPKPHRPLPSSRGVPGLCCSRFTQGWAFRAKGAFYTIYLIKTPRAESSTGGSASAHSAPRAMPGAGGGKRQHSPSARVVPCASRGARVPKGQGGMAGLDARVSSCVQVCPQPYLAPPAMPRASWGCTPKATPVLGYSRALATSLRRHLGGLCNARCPGWVGVPFCRDGGALPGKREAPPGNEQPRFHSNLKGPQLPPHRRSGCDISGGHPARPPARHPGLKQQHPVPSPSSPQVAPGLPPQPCPCSETPKRCRPLTPRGMGPPPKHP